MVISVEIYAFLTCVENSNLDYTTHGRVCQHCHVSAPEDEKSSGDGGVGEDVEEAEGEEGEDVLHVVQVRPTHSLHILVQPSLRYASNFIHL